MNMSAFRDVASLSLVGTERRSDDGGSKHLRNVGKCLTHYTAQHPRRRTSSASKNDFVSNVISKTV